MTSYSNGVVIPPVAEPSVKPWRQSGSVCHGLLAWSGLLFLLAGALFYLLFRPAGSVRLLPLSFFHPIDTSHWGAILQVVLGSFPELVHTTGFALLTCAVWKGDRRISAWICLSWAVINVLFELGQLPPVARWISNQPGSDHARFITAFFLNGTFDQFDLYASILGGWLAWIIVVHFSENQK